ncbi:hypothetical protein L1987_39828 [Smallanthus sonchifolius]|uniref:Uncharacterized protein n=1 Tax=Smallanthus sonchifolius TaxID=185202 RepID=A0ACB9GU89_9ASTR|nr:hypothetical protein L1987_39828 [Smallanthus sonchifolius]
MDMSRRSSLFRCISHMGPKRIFGSLGNYSFMNWFFLGGALGPIVIWLFYKAFPKQTWLPLGQFSTILFSATGNSGGKGTIIFSPRVAFMAVLLYFSVGVEEKGVTWWGTDGEHCKLATCPTAKGINVDGCPVN